MSAAPALGYVPRQARGIEKRRRLYEETLAQMAAKGVDATRVEDVVAAAGVSWGTFFRYFPRKEDVLLEAAVIHHRGHVQPVVDRGLQEGRPARELALDTFLATLEPVEHPAALHGAIVAEVLGNPQRFAALLGDDPPVTALVARTVAAGQARGEVRGDLDALTLAAVLAAGTLFPTLNGSYLPPRGLEGLRAADGPAAMARRAFGVAWRGLEPLD